MQFPYPSSKGTQTRERRSMIDTNDSTSQKIKAIETEYKGYRFRSRLEARWAVYFDNTVLEPDVSARYGVPPNKPYVTWDYEKEGFELSNGDRYLPDFYLRPYHCYAEVKPEPLNQTDANLLFKFVKETGYRLLLLIGIPDQIPFTLIDIYRSYVDTLPEYKALRVEYQTTDEDNCHTGCGRKDFKKGVVVPKDIETCCVCMFDYAGIKERRFYVMPCGNEFENFDKLIYNPVSAARRARFEYGEHP